MRSNYEISRRCCQLGVQADVGDIEKLSTWQRQRLLVFLKNKTRTLPRVLMRLADTPDLRVPWVEDVIHDAEDVMRELGLSLTRIHASRIRRRLDTETLDLKIQEFWAAKNDAWGSDPPEFDLGLIPDRSELEWPEDILASTQVSIPAAIGNAAKIFEQLVDLNHNLKQFLSALNAISLEPDIRSVDAIFHDEELIRHLRKCGIMRVCDLIVSVTSGQIWDSRLTHKEKEAACRAAAEQTEAAFDSIRRAVVANATDLVDVPQNHNQVIAT